MSKLLFKPKNLNENGKVVSINKDNSGLNYVSFEVYKLQKGQSASAPECDSETCLVFVSGKGLITVGGESLGEIGKRMSPFDGKPWAVYVPGHSAWEVTATTDAEIAVCLAPSQNGKLPSRVIAPDDIGMEERGTGTNTRHVCNILPETEPADSLLVVEVITPGGNWSSYPPHKHDTDNLPHESLLEETYYHRINPPQGFAFQRVYTDDRSLDETVAISNGDVVCVPKGYHPCGAAHGYDLYYLNVMAGPKRTWKFQNDPHHEWMLNA